MNDISVFHLEIIQQDQWPPGTTEILALIRVTASPGEHPDAAASAAGVAEVIIMDCSGSMGYPVGKLHAAQRAAHVALDAMRDGVEFAVLSGTDSAEVVYPRGFTLARATPGTRAAAKRAIDRLYANGGTKISSWLNATRQLLEPFPQHIRHAMLFTDGKNEHESQGGELDGVLDACRGVFTCDARGIGDQWEPKDLGKIVTALNGQAAGLPDMADLPGDFRAIMQAAMGKVVPSVVLRLRTPSSVTVREVRQIHPTDASLTGREETADATAADYWIGSWSNEIRDYIVKLAVDPRDFVIGKEVRIARVEVLARDPVSPRVLTEPGFIVACWTPDGPVKRTWLPSDNYSIQQTAGDATRTGCQAWHDRDLAEAEAAWGEAVRLANAASDARRLAALASLVHIVDAASGQVQLRDDLTTAVVKRAELQAATSSFVPAQPSGQDSRLLADPAGRLGAPSACPDCGRKSPPGAAYCEQCGRTLGSAVSGPDGTPRE